MNTRLFAVLAVALSLFFLTPSIQPTHTFASPNAQVAPLLISVPLVSPTERIDAMHAEMIEALEVDQHTVLRAPILYVADRTEHFTYVERQTLEDLGRDSGDATSSIGSSTEPSGAEYALPVVPANFERLESVVPQPRVTGISLISEARADGSPAPSPGADPGLWSKVLGALLALSELLSFIPGVRANGVVQLIFGFLAKLAGK